MAFPAGLTEVACRCGVHRDDQDDPPRERGTSGAPRIRAELREGYRVFCSQKRVARLMARAGIQGVSRRRRVKTTRPEKAAAPAPDLLERDFGATEPDRKWVADITYVPTWAGFLYLAVVLDCSSRRVVGWCMREDLSTRLVLDALEMAIANRRPRAGLILHSDRGCQYTSYVFGRRCKDAGIVPSMDSVGDAYDNAAESFFARLECELIDRSTFRTRTEARMAVFDFIEAFYNPRRRHSSIGMLSAADFERRSAQDQTDVA